MFAFHRDAGVPVFAHISQEMLETEIAQHTKNWWSLYTQERISDLKTQIRTVVFDRSSGSRSCLVICDPVFVGFPLKADSGQGLVAGRLFRKVRGVHQ